MRDLEVLCVPDCPNLPVLLERLEAATSGSTPIRTTVLDPGSPAPAGFAGSPTLLIDGVNPFGEAGAADASACALTVPSPAQLKEALDPQR